jgi:hypothetical protein
MNAIFLLAVEGARGPPKLQKKVGALKITHDNFAIVLLYLRFYVRPECAVLRRRFLLSSKPNRRMLGSAVHLGLPWGETGKTPRQV